MIEVYTLGGFSEVGRNMAAVKVDDEIVILDMGFHLTKLINFEEQGGDRKNITTKDLIKTGAIPDDSPLDKERSKVKAIVLSHCHLDHIGATPFLAMRYNAPIIGTPYTIEVLRNSLRDDHVILKNEIKSISPNSRFKISDNLEVELVNITHSTLQTAVVIIHTKYGAIVYANDFKLDPHPYLDKKTNVKRLKQIGKEGVKLLISECLYADKDRKTPSEKVARMMLKDVMHGVENRNNAILVSCFASNIARIKSIVEFSHELDRKVVIFGRSMHKYISAAERLNLVKISNKAKIFKYGNQVKRMLGSIEKKDRDKYVIIPTGGQAEPGAVLTRIANGQLPFEFFPDDSVIFSNRIIPEKNIIKNREELESKLKRKKVRVFRHVHVSGHGSREDLRDMIKILCPENLIPIHAGKEKQDAFRSLAEEMGYHYNKNIFY